MIDLAAVAERINALDGWSAVQVGSWLRCSRKVGAVRESIADIRWTGEVKAGPAVVRGNAILILPVLQIVAEAMA